MRELSDSVDSDIKGHCEYFLNTLNNELDLSQLLDLFRHDPAAAHSALVAAQEMIGEKRRLSRVLLNSLKNEQTFAQPEISVLDNDQVSVFH